MHSPDRLANSLLDRFEVAYEGLAPHLIGWRVSLHVGVPLHVRLMLRNALLAKCLLVIHVVCIDSQVMSRAYCILLNAIHLWAHAILYHLLRCVSLYVLIHNKLIHWLIDRGKRIKILHS